MLAAFPFPTSTNEHLALLLCALHAGTCSRKSLDHANLGIAQKVVAFHPLSMSRICVFNFCSVSKQL
jgi:hypothetical protein